MILMATSVDKKQGSRQRGDRRGAWLKRRRKPLRPRRVKGVPNWWARLRYLIWSWWIWAVGATAAFYFDRSNSGLGLLAAAIVVYVFAPRERAPQYGLDHDFPIKSDEFLSTIVGATGAPFRAGNSFDIYNNGDEFYPVMVDAIHEARESITVEAYIYWEGNIGKMFAEALAAKAGEGVTVKILLDSVGSSSIGAELLGILEKGGCQVRWYNPIHWYSISRLNNRTHRKSLIIDGHTGFTGAAGIADHWMGKAETSEHWRDIMVRVRGEAVVPLQTGFARNWLQTTGELVTGATFYPKLRRYGQLDLQTILSSPETGSSEVQIMYYLSIACARESILIANPYFVPDDIAIQTLVEARRRGVDVKIMVTGIHNDVLITRLNSIRLYGRLLASGVEIYEYNRTMMHHKYMTCDGIWSTIGTTNFDNRAFALNEENNVCIYDREVARRFERIFREDLSACERIEYKRWRKRSIVQKVCEHLASFLKEQV